MKKILKRHLSKYPIIKRQYQKFRRAYAINPMEKLQQTMLSEMMPSNSELAAMRKKAEAFVYQPLISIIMPTYNTDLGMLVEAIESVHAQAYENWELVIVDDCSPNAAVRDKINEYARKDTRIVTEFLSTNHHIAGATNRGFEVATGDYIALFDHDDYLYPNALFENVLVINQYPQLCFIYSDEDKIDEHGNHHFDPYLKPEFNPDFLRCMNMITHFVVFKKELLSELGGEDKGYNGAQDWEFVMRLTDHLALTEIYHINKVIYSWRVHSNSTAMSTGTKPYVPEAQRNLLRKDLANKDAKGVKIYENYESIGQWLFQYPIQDNFPLVSIVIKDEGNIANLERLLNSIFIKTSYFNYEIILDSKREASLEILRAFTVKHENISESINGEYVLVVSSQLEILTFDWIEKLLGQAQREEIAYVMPRLVGEAINEVKSVGIVVTDKGEILNLLNGFDTLGLRTLSEHIYLSTHHYISGVNPSCYMVSKALYHNQTNALINSLQINRKGLHNLFISDVQIRTNQFDLIPKSYGIYKEFENFQDLYVNANFLKIERKFIRGE
ncbi:MULTISPECIES: glycosyltransferase [unclassified Enterococcus]|uniref:glycosyltransferase family 2 protein n=1 Tax=unclassified Enterococcus TaxID=2608891 RepID=UPI001555ECE6|nr:MULTISPECIES: glycosyltransferase [unclassified Enterococcus]MBS7577282.1 glycosyltransferase [Enterococcus sp. MMGLQ5-2]MBS7584625.1 glycosyltransferase [Enterococcus sp. MMGLQ5-1]NPD12480.1 glycosyltransferase [Enterococcus sp. MMGLQ5-1]NPD37116.1 glycosyltransferase [Enterococcus sp. MMGLQ5-2]